MKFVKEIYKKSISEAPKELRKFGFIFAAMLIGVFYFFFPWLAGSEHRPQVLFYVSAALVFFAALWPPALKPVFFLATLIGTVLGAINSRILLFLVFFAFLTPLAWLRKLTSKNNAMGNKDDAALDTYRISCKDRDLMKNKEKAF